MEITELDNQKMKVMEELASTQMLISGMKAEMMSLDSKKEEFFVYRENEVLARIHKLLNNSRTLLDEVKTNYEEVHNFYLLLKEFSDFLTGTNTGLTRLMDDFIQKSTEHNAILNKREMEIEELRKDLEYDQAGLKRDKNFIEKEKKKIAEAKRHIESQQASLKTSYEQSKRVWDKIK